jgi:hypothetical protein
MGSSVSFSGEVLRIQEVAQKHRDTDKSLRFYYTAPGLPQRDLKFVGYSPNDVQRELGKRLSELDRDSAFGVLGALEASFRMDFLERCQERWKDDLSRNFRELEKLRGKRVALEEDILGAWKQHVPSAKALISDIIGAFRYRHWLAHGRYWVPKLGKLYDFSSVYLLAQRMEQVFLGQNG